MELEKKYEIRDNHIGIFDNFIDENLINNLLLFFKENEQLGKIQDRYNWQRAHKHYKDDFLIIPISSLKEEIIFHFFEKIYPYYIKQYSILNEYDFHTIYDMNIQKILPGGGYHMWHCENQIISNRNRILAWMLYLNDIKDGGETEFLYQKCRIQPKRNRFLLWPSGFTHIHRGNPPLKEDKYILTGWVEFGIK